MHYVKKPNHRQTQLSKKRWKDKDPSLSLLFYSNLQMVFPIGQTELESGRQGMLVMQSLGVILLSHEAG